MSSQTMTTRSMAKSNQNKDNIVVSETNIVKKEPSLFKKFESMLKEQGKYAYIYPIIDYIYENCLFGEETHIGDYYDEIIYKIPYEEWELVTGIDREQIEYLQSLIGDYCGSIAIESEEYDSKTKKFYVELWSEP